MHPVQHVPGVMNPADIPTRPFTTPEEVLEGSVWQNGPHFFALSKDQWPFPREFMDMVPASELRSPRAVYGTMATEVWTNLLGPSLSQIITLVMEKSNCLSKTTHVTARLLKCYFGMSKSRIEDPLTVTDIEVARKLQFVASMGPTLEAMDEGELLHIRPILDRGIVYTRGRLEEKTLMDLFGVRCIPILARKT